jgi:hypothetical protein
MPAPLTLGQAADLVDKSIGKIWIKASTPEEKYKLYFNFRPNADYYEEDSSLSGLGEADFVSENAVFTSDIPAQGYNKKYTQEMISKLLPISYQMWKFGIKKRNLTNIVNELKKSDLRKREKLCAELLTNGWSSSYTHTGGAGTKTVANVGGDGVEPFSIAHTREDGGTNMNNIVYDGTTYNMSFDYAALKAAHLTASKFVDSRGNPDPAHLDTLVCKAASSVYFKAVEILGAIKSGKIPESFDNDAAAVPAFKIIALDYLTNDAYWFMFDSSKKGDEYGFQFLESEAPNLDAVNTVYKTKELQVSEQSMIAWGFNDVARMWVGSQGDNT